MSRCRERLFAACRPGQLDTLRTRPRWQGCFRSVVPRSALRALPLSSSSCRACRESATQYSRPFFACSAGMIQRSPSMCPQIARCASPIRCPVNSRNRRSGRVETVRAKGGGFHHRSEHGAVPALDHLQGPLTGGRSAMPQCSRHRVQSVLRMDRGTICADGTSLLCVTTQRMPNG